MIEIQHLQRNEENLLHVALSGKLTTREFEVFFAQLESDLGALSNLRVVFELGDVSWQRRSGWTRLSFDSRHRTDIRKLAIIGDLSQSEWMASACEPLTVQEVQLFQPTQRKEALDWIGS